MVNLCHPRVMVALVMCSVAVLEVHAHPVEGRKGGRGSRRKSSRIKNETLSSSPQNVTVHHSSPDPIMAAAGGGTLPGVREENFEKSIEEMVLQVRNNSALSKNKINHDENRIPVDIPEAKCSCTGCINPFTMQEDRTLSSVLIYTKIPVRRLLCKRPTKKQRKRKKCEPQYKTVVESVAVGCTCIV